MDKSVRISGTLQIHSKLDLINSSKLILSKLFNNCNLNEITVSNHDEAEVIYLIDFLGLGVKIYGGDILENGLHYIQFMIVTNYKRPFISWPPNFDIEYVSIEGYLYDLFTETFKNDDAFVKISRYTNEVN
jgi:hypothetical protein